MNVVIIYNSEIVPYCTADLSALVCTGASVAKATGFGYAPINGIVCEYGPRACLLTLSPTGITWDMT